MRASFFAWVLLAFSASAAAGNPTTFYRAEHIAPADAFANGIAAPPMARKDHPPSANPVSQHLTAFNRNRSMLVSVTESESIAREWSALIRNRQAYVYVIDGDDAFYSVATSLEAELNRVVDAPEDMPASRRNWIVDRIFNLRELFGSQQEWVVHGEIPGRNIKEARYNYREVGGQLVFDTVVNPGHVPSTHPPTSNPFPLAEFLHEDRADVLSLIGDGRYWSVSFTPTYCTRLPTGANCPPSSYVAITPSPQLELQFGVEQQTGLPEGAKRWWVDLDDDNQLDYCWADGGNTTMACAYNRELVFTAVRATSSGVDLGWTEGAEWVRVSSLQAPDFCRLVDSSTKIRCSRVAKPGVAGGLWEGGDFVSAHIDAGYPRDRFWGDVGNAAGAADGRSDFCRILDYGHPQGGYALGCQLASATGTFGGEWRGDVLLPLTNDMVGNERDKALVDINGDQRADFCVAAYDQAFIKCILASGSGASFWGGTVYLETPSRSYVRETAQWVDFNKDGKVDFCAAFHASNGKRLECFTQWDTDTTRFAQLLDAPIQDAGWPGYSQFSDVGGRGLGNFCTQVDNPRSVQCAVPHPSLNSVALSVSPTLDAGWGDVANHKQVYLPRTRGGHGAYCRSTDIGFGGQIVCRKIW